MLVAIGTILLAGCGGGATRSTLLTIPAGAQSTFSHGLTNAVTMGFFRHNGIWLPTAEYSVSLPARFGPPVDDFIAGRVEGFDGEVLSNGNYLLVNFEEFAVVSPTGTQVVPLTSFTGGNPGCGTPRAASLDGHFLIAFCQDPSPALTIRKYTNAGTEVIGGNFPMVVSDGFDVAFDIASVGTGFAVFAADGAAVRVRRYSATGAMEGTEYTDPGTSVFWVAVEALTDGRVLLVHARDKTPSGPYHTVATVLNAANAQQSRVELSGTSLGRIPAMARAANGNVLVAFELGGPDALAYTVFSGAGQQLVESTLLTDHEPRDFNVGTFGNGDFAVIMTDDESNVGMFWNVRNGGSLVHTRPMLLDGGYAPDRRMLIFPTGPHTANVVYDVYSTPDARLIPIAKNYIEIVDANGSTTVGNYTGRSVDVRLIATGE
jgi:hypothetical protein